MARFVAVNKQEHLNAGWYPPQGMQFAAGDMTVPILLEELPYILATMPAVFVRHQDQYELHALLSLIPGKNLFVGTGGAWIGGYIPSAYRGYPFKAIKTPEEGKLALCIDTESGLWTEQAAGGANRLFDADGEPAKAMQDILMFMQKCERSRQITQIAVEALARHDLLESFDVRVEMPDKEVKPVEGLSIVNEKALRQLSGEALAELNKANALALAWGQLYSQHRIKGLGTLIDMYKKASKPQEIPEDLSGILGAQNDTISF